MSSTESRGLLRRGPRLRGRRPGRGRHHPGRHGPVVIVSLADFESLRETADLMRSPANARRLLDALERLEAGHGEVHDLADVD